MIRAGKSVRILLLLILIVSVGFSVSHADDVIFTEDFESGWGLWYADNGVWQVGTPTAGPDACHSGENCAGTILDGDYPGDTDSRLVSPPVSLPAVASGEAIYLSFWQWFSYAGGGNCDYGQVQISVWDNNTSTWLTWTDIDNFITDTSSWSKMAIDLTGYAGEQVRIAFYHTATTSGFPNACGLSSTGWYIDDVELITKVPEFTGDFESGWEDWSADRGVWQVGTPTAGPDACHSGENCAGTILDNDYPGNTDSRLVSPPVSLPAVAGGEAIYLSFWQWFSYAGGGNCDYGQVQISVWDNNTSTWLTWTDIDNFITDTSSWSKMAIDLTGYAGEQVRIAFYHTATTSGFPNACGLSSTGWYIDDVELITKVPEFTGDFESGWEDWSADRGVWQVGTPTAGPDACHSGENCAGTILDNDYPGNTDSRLVSPPINLPDAPCNGIMSLRFWQWFSYAGGGNCDIGQVQISIWEDDNTAWSDWTSIGNPIANSSTWSPNMIDLTAYAGERIKVGFYHTATTSGFPNACGLSSTGWYIDDVDFPGLSPEIDSISYDLFVPKGDSAIIAVVANDPCGGSLEYKWNALDGGTIVGDGPNVSFIMPVEERFCPYRVRVAVTSEETHIGTTSIIKIYNRCPGDGNENGVTNILDKVLVRNAFGTQCGDPRFDPRADVNCDCVVNILDKVQVRNSFGCSQ